MLIRQVAVLFKVVPDPEGVYQAVPGGGVPGAGLPRVPSVFDENATEAAVRLKEATGCRVSVFSVATADAEPMLRRTLAMGADEAVLIEHDTGWDSLGAARLISAALRERGPYDLVLCGREAADTGAGLVGPYVAQSLGMPFLTLVTDIVVADGALRVKRLCDGGHDTFRCHPPMLFSVSGEANRPRMPSVIKVLQAKKSAVPRLRLDADVLPVLPGPAAARLGGRTTPTSTGNCTTIGGANAAEQSAGLIEALRREGAL